MHKIRDGHFQCVNNHYEKFEYKGMKSVGDTIQAFLTEKMSKLYTPKNENTFTKGEQNIRCTS